MSEIVFGKKKDTEIVKPKTKFISCVKSDAKIISVKKTDAVLIGKIDINDIPVIREKEENQCFLENSDGFYDGKTFGGIENAKDFTNFDIESFSKSSVQSDDELLLMIKQKYGIFLTKNIQNNNYKKVYYKVKIVKEFSKI